MTHTSTKQPEALRLADCLEGNSTTPWTREEAATELRHLHARVQVLQQRLADTSNAALVPEGLKLVPEDANRPMLESGKKVLENKVCTPGLTAQAVYKAMLYAAPQPPAEDSAKVSDVILQMVRDQEAKKATLIAKGICPTCKGEGECGGQFTGGERVCEDCEGSGRYQQKL